MTLSALQKTGFNQIPGLPGLGQMLRKARTIAICAIALTAFQSLTLACAGHCEDREGVCVRVCLGGGSSGDAAACLIGCKLAYWACKALGG